ncbi:MAG: hypothetical protein A2562_04345 [Candidatus Nealsonbacteria bacterium RIFOXYD1_FULL_39_11]|nr:MAG: hypothetical protein A2562_04345 [Candidatus Nealsonbacteria bacterium RIFOXYD1_FULL_39_11]
MVAKIKKKKRSWKHILIYSFSGIIMVLAIIFLSLTNWKIYQRKANLNEKIAELQGEISVLEERKIELSGLISYVQSDDYVEQVARDQLNMKRPGEEVVVIQDDKKDSGDKEREVGWWEKLKSIFSK